MGLATSQVRLLALTARKADVEMQIQLNSKRKTMLTREATQLSKLYYAKLNNAKYQYATSNGFADINYNYLMGYANQSFFKDIMFDMSNSGLDKKSLPSMILTDNFGRVILDDDMMKIMTYVLNNQTSLGVNIDSSSVEQLTMAALRVLLMDTETGDNDSKMDSGGNNITGKGIAASANVGDAAVATYFENLYNDVTGKKALQYLMREGYRTAGELYINDGKFYVDKECKTEATPNEGYFYNVKKPDGSAYLGDTYAAMYINGGFSFTDKLNSTVAKEIVNLMEYYGSMFSAAFNGNGSTIAGDPIKHYNVTAKISYDSNAEAGERYTVDSNGVYQTVMNKDKLQDGLKSGIYQLVNVINPTTGGYSKGQNIDYFRAQNQILEKMDNNERESITAWYQSERAALSEKESYWDSEISDLSTELNTITTEIESVKKLRSKAIDSTFKWGSA